MSCPAVGVMGIHSDSFYGAEGSLCQWCGAQGGHRLRWVGMTAMVELTAFMGAARHWGKRQWHRNYSRMRRHYNSRVWSGQIGSFYGTMVIRSNDIRSTT